MAKKKVKKQKENSQIIVDYGETMTDIKVAIRGAAKINARILQRTIREITRQRKVELKKLIYADRLDAKDFAAKFKEKADGTGRISEENGRDSTKAAGDDLSVEQLADEVGRKF